MTIARVTDLDELALTVRDRTSKSYIIEAINAYRGGAYRSAIISTWIAVSYDIIAKLRELALQNDAAAIQWISGLDNAIANNQISKLQVLEEQILNVAETRFEFFAPHEAEDLQRLKRDRNYCAHPAFVAEDVLFQPTPDLVRTHIVHAVIHLLSQEPVQGRKAVTRLCEDLLRESFPEDIESTAVFMNSKYLNRARRTLVESIIDVLIKTILKGDDSEFRGKRSRLVRTLVVVSYRHPQIYEQRMSTKFREIAENLNDEQLKSAIRLISADNRCWQWLGEAERIRLKHIINRADSNSILRFATVYKAFDLLVIDELRPLLLNLFSKSDEATQQNVISKSPRSEFAARAIEFYSSARGFRGAEALGESVIEPMIPFFSADDVNRIVEIARENDQIRMASGTKDILVKLFDKTLNHLSQTKDEWKLFVERAARLYEPDDYYAYPELQQRLRDRGVNFTIPPRDEES